MALPRPRPYGTLGPLYGEYLVLDPDAGYGAADASLMTQPDYGLTPEQIAEADALRSFGLGRVDAGFRARDEDYWAQKAAELGQQSYLLTGSLPGEATRIYYYPDTQYRLLSDGKVIGEAKTQQQFEDLVALQNQLSAQAGRKGNFEFQSTVPYTLPSGEEATTWGKAFVNQPDETNLAEQFLKAAAIIGASAVGGHFLGPVFGGVSKAGQVGLLGGSKLAGTVGFGLGSGIGSVAGNLATGKNIEDALKAGAITAVTAGALRGIGADKAIGNLLTPAKSAASQALSSGAGALGSAGADEIIVSAVRDALASSVIPGIAGLGSTGVASVQPTLQQLSDMYGPAPVDPNEILVSASKGIGGTGLSSAVAGAAAPVVSSLEQPVQRYEPQPVVEEPEAVVTQQKLADLGLVPAIAPTVAGISGLTQPTVQEILPSEELITVSGDRIPLRGIDAAIAAVAPILSPSVQQPVQRYEPPSSTVEEPMLESTATRIPQAGISAAAPLIANIVGAQEALGRLPESVEEEAIVTGQRPEDVRLAGGLAGVVPALISGAPGEVITEVVGQRIPPKAIDSALAAAAPALVAETPPAVPDEIVVTNSKTKPTLSSTLPAVAGTIPPTTPPTVPDEIVVTSTKTKPQFPTGTLVSGLGDLGQTGVPPIDTTPTAPDKGKSTLGQIADALTIASVVAGAIGGGGGGGGGTLDTGTGYGVPQGRGRRRMPATFDPFTYGQKEGEFEFFQDLLASAAPAAAPPPMAEGGEAGDDMISHLIAYRKGGGHDGPGRVRGIGSGQEDKIPAWLSDGEYVWSAQDVADLGDGSTDEGVRRLDKMRQMVRRRAGRKDVKKIAKPQRGIEDMLKAVGGAV